MYTTNVSSLSGSCPFHGTSGLYYPADSLKTRLCLRGRHLMYAYCQQHNIPHKKVGKLVVARDSQRSYVEGLHTKAQKLCWPAHSPPHLSHTPVLPHRANER